MCLGKMIALLVTGDTGEEVEVKFFLVCNLLNGRLHFHSVKCSSSISLENTDTSKCTSYFHFSMQEYTIEAWLICVLLHTC